MLDYRTRNDSATFVRNAAMPRLSVMATISLSRARAFLVAALIAVVAALTPQRLVAAPFDRQDLQRIEHRVQTVAEKNLPAIVALTHGSKEGIASGSGTIISKDGLIVTAAHVVRGADLVDVTFPDGTRRKAKVLGGDAGRDIALARINEAGEYPFVELGHSKDLKIGDIVVAMGHAGGFDDRRQPPVRLGRIFDTNPKGFLRSDCTLIGGDSGGPLFDLDGKIVGVHSNIGVDMSVNNDVPIEVAHAEWDRLMAGERWGKPLDQRPPPKLKPEELAGLNVEAFRHRVMEAAIANNGQLAADPKTISKWLTDCGMKADRVKAMSQDEVVKFLGKVMGDGASVEGKPGRRARAKANADAAGPATQPVAASTRPSTNPAVAENSPAAPATQPAGFDAAKLNKIVAAAAMKSGGQLQVSPDRIAGWLKEAGMPADEVAKLSPMELVQKFQKAIKGMAQVASPAFTERQRAIVEMDRKVLETIHGDLKAAAPSIATLQKEGKTLALGTIIHANGLILTKRSEITSAGDKLTAKLSGGRSLPAKIVKEFADHDLAVVKIDAEGLTPVTFADDDDGVRPGSFLFAAAPAGSGETLLATGVASVPTRSLRDTGGFMGIGLAENNGVVTAGSVMPGGPAAKAGLKDGDILLSLDGTEIKSASDLSRRVRKLSPGTVVHLTYRRPAAKAKAEAKPEKDDAKEAEKKEETPEKTATIKIGDREKLPGANKPDGNPALEMTANVSKVRSGFPAVLQHDLPIDPKDCGGPLVDLNGKVVGIDIARAGRINSYAIPAATIAKLLPARELEKLAATK
jgi:S1-C subfamily serine protease